MNLLSMWAPLLSLTLRLFGNAIAGWALLTIVETSLREVSGQLFHFMPVLQEAQGYLPTDFLYGNWNEIFLSPIPTAILHAYFDLFSGLIQTVVFISLTAIFVGQEIPEDLTYNLPERRAQV